MEMAARGPDGEPVTRRFGVLHVSLYLIALLLGCACVVGTVLTIKEHRQRAEEADGQPRVATAAEEDRYGAVKSAAGATAQALVNIDYRTPQASIDNVAKTATGTFLKQYSASSHGLVQLVKNYKAVLTGNVSETAVSDVDDDSATVLVATEGQVTNSATGQAGQARNFRLLVKLVMTDDGWRANDLEFVG